MKTQKHTTEQTQQENQQALLSSTKQDTGNAKEDQNNLNSFEIEEIQGTPFHAVKNENGWQTVMGDYVITKTFKNHDELIKYIREKPYEVIMAIILAMKDIDNKKTNK